MFTALNERIIDLEQKRKLWDELDALLADVDAGLSENESSVSSSLATKQDLDKMLVRLTSKMYDECSFLSVGDIFKIQLSAEHFRYIFCQ